MQALSSTELFRRDLKAQPVLFEEHSGVRKVILNRPSKLNALTFEMVYQMFKKLQIYEDDHTVNFVILKVITGKRKSILRWG
ncbi:probable 3-hydroxyisobutyryl-CoA hydrolase 3 [Syzygium oleosum]|uniref:probable 3-hydroxyisobutyryl-CoA hydrolase 3 n=1 Tax=Syzygium oleosum TaxID=219896 RepID=UPI0024BB801D|nr:probable 3-hydroxyisobutyryl-CoA hydrolase 3 [Syzygium oleosum]